jgi:hypothetical protein
VHSLQRSAGQNMQAISMRNVLPEWQRGGM